MIDSESEEGLFYKDYKQTTYGFSVVKCQVPGTYDEIARANNLKNHLPLTIVKQVVYDHRFASIRLEIISMVFNNDFHDKGFRKAVTTIIETASQAFHGTEAISVEK